MEFGSVVRIAASPIRQVGTKDNQLNWAATRALEILLNLRKVEIIQNVTAEAIQWC